MQENNLGVGRDERNELGSAGGSGGAVSRPSGGVLGQSTLTKIIWLYMAYRLA